MINQRELAETAMCLWEAFLEAEAAVGRDGDDSFDLPERAPPRHPYPNLHKLRRSYGTWRVRHKILDVAEACEEGWLAQSDDERNDAGAFDWEFCPDWLAEFDATLAD